MNNYTPIFEAIIAIDDINLTTAGVFGVIWRYCQDGEGVCWAKLETIANKLGTSERTVMRSVTTLKEKGLIQQLESSANAPNRYKITVTGELLTKKSAPKAEPEKPIQGDKMSPSDSFEGDKMSGLEVPQGDKMSGSRVTFCHPQGEKISHEERYKKEVKKEEIYNAIISVCEWPNMVTLVSSQLNRLLDVGDNFYNHIRGSPNDLNKFKAWWLKNDWRGQKGTPPTPEQVLEVWPQFSKNGHGTVRISEK